MTQTASASRPFAALDTYAVYTVVLRSGGRSYVYEASSSTDREHYRAIADYLSAAYPQAGVSYTAEMLVGYLPVAPRNLRPWC